MSIATVLTMLANSQQTIDEINQACITKGLPPALKFGENMIQIEGNRDYRFEGFGMVAGLPPKLAFWVHYKPGSPDHVGLGRFTMPISIGKIAEIRSLIGTL